MAAMLTQLPLPLLPPDAQAARRFETWRIRPVVAWYLISRLSRLSGRSATNTGLNAGG